MQKVLIIGASSAMAQETARIYAKEGAKLFLIVRDENKFAVIRDDLIARGASEVGGCFGDILQQDLHDSWIDQAWQSLDGIDIALLAHGTLGDQDAGEQDFAIAERELQTNFITAASLLTLLANRMAGVGSGTLAVISSVAGDRGRQSNYIYGAAKAGLNAFLSGLRNRLQPLGVHVLTIKPGFVSTPMTAHLDQGPLFASARSVGSGIHRAIKKKKNIAYLPFFWWGIMVMIRHVPESIFKRLKL